MAMPGIYRSYSSPLAWESAWHGYLETTRTDFSQIVPEGAGPMAPVQLFPVAQAELCRLQRKLSSLVTQKITEDDFENKWRAAGPAAREQHYFEAVERALEYGEYDVNMDRQLAPEITLQKFQSNNGQGYLDLLKALSTTGVPANQYVRIPHPAIDHQWFGRVDTSDALPLYVEDFNRRIIDVKRGMFLSHMIGHTLLSFYNMPAFHLDNFKPVMSPEQQAIIQAAVTIAPLQQPPRQENEPVCQNCKKPEPSPFTFLTCSKCKAIRYCGPECQLNDWRSGNPSHKFVCDQLSSKPLARVIPPPSPNYSRSAALVQQIRLLEQHPSVDYVIMSHESPSGLGVTCEPTLPDAKLFVRMRDQAFEKGDKDAVVVMYQVLEHINAAIPSFEMSVVAEQLGREFGVDGKEVHELSKSPSAGRRLHDLIGSILVA